MKVSFSHAAFRKLLRTMIERFGTTDFRVCRARRDDRNQCVLRHDVDRRPRNALRIASIEALLGVRATFYFRRREIRRQVPLIRRIAEAGHEIGYHYEALALARGNLSLAREIMIEDLEALRRTAPVTTAAMHGSPLSAYSNLSVWQSLSLRDVGLDSEAFLVVNSPDWIYFTDTGRTWKQRVTNLRDYAPNAAVLPPGVATTRELAGYIAAMGDGNLCVTAHPERWNPPGATYLLSFAQDALSNLIKLILRGMRSLRR
jgi:hypothetical protein